MVRNSNIRCSLQKGDSGDGDVQGVRYKGIAPCDTGIIMHGNNSKAVNNYFSGPVDGIDPCGINIEITGNYFHNLTVVWEEWRTELGDTGDKLFSHADAIQLATGTHSDYTAQEKPTVSTSITPAINMKNLDARLNRSNVRFHESPK